MHTPGLAYGPPTFLAIPTISMKFSQGIRTVSNSHSSDIEAQLFKTLFTDVPATLTNEGSTPSFVLLPICSMIVSPKEPHEENQKGRKRHSIDLD